jgi:PAS domain S-box-containing protein
MEGTRHRWFSVAGIAPWAVLFVGFIAALVIAHLFSRSLSRTAEENVSLTAQAIYQRMRVDLQSTSDLIQATRGLYHASDDVTRIEFDHFLEGSPLLHSVPGFMSIVWMPVVPADELDAFETAVRRDTSINPDGYPWFSVKRRSGADAYVVATYVYPHTQDREVMGYDGLADPERVAALAVARDNGELSGVASARLIQGGPGLVVYGPMYGSEEHPATVPERRQLLSGYIGIAFYIDRLAEHWGQEINAIRIGDVYVELHDIGVLVEGDTRLAAIGNARVAGDDSLRRATLIQYLDTDMELRIWAPPTFGLSSTERALPLVVALSVVALAVGAFRFITIRSRARAESQRVIAEMRTRVELQAEQLKKANERLSVQLQLGTEQIQERVVELEQSRAAMLSLLEDLTESRSKLEDVVAFDDAILTSLSDGLIVIDKNMIVTRVNEAMCTIIGSTEAQLLGKITTEALVLLKSDGSPVPLEQRPAVRMLKQGPQARASREPDLTLRRPDGIVVPIDFAISPIIKDGAIAYLVALVRDVTIERTIDRAKSEFVTLASHQLRTPLTAIAWYVELVLSEKHDCLGDEQLQYLHEIEGANRRMINLVDSLLNVSRLEMGSITVEPKDIDFSKSVGDILDDFIALLTRRSVTLARELDSSIGMVQMDSKLMEVVVQNIVSNAIKYTPAGGAVRVTTYRADPWIVLTVTDTGIGIPRQQQTKVFEKLFRADNAMKSDTDGTGLGMYIVKSIMQAIGGDIAFVSEEGKGTTFTVRFPRTGMAPKAGTRKLVGKTLE